MLPPGAGGGQASWPPQPAEGPWPGALAPNPSLRGKLRSGRPGLLAPAHGLPGPLRYLVIPFAQELQPLGPLVHEDAIQVPRLHRADFDGLFAPAHDLVGADVR